MPAGLSWPVFACLLGLWPLLSVAAQELDQPPAPGSAGAPSAARATDDAKPPSASATSPLDTFFLRDKKGNLVPVPGLSFEEFERLTRLARGLAGPELPGYVISRLTAEGALEGDIAAFRLTLSVQLRDEGWVAVPIQLVPGVLGPERKYDGPGEHFLAPQGDGNGYVCWLKGKDSRPHQVTFDVSFPVALEDDKRRLRASFPPATESRIQLALSHTAAEPVLERGVGIVSASAKPGGQTQVTMLGAAGDLVLSWQAAAASAGSGRTRLEATGEISVQIESEQRITSEARLRVRSLGGPVERITVQLPPGMELVQGPPAPDYTIRELEAIPEPASARQRVLVEFARPLPAADVVLRAHRQPSPGLKATFRPADYVVEQALRQRGTIEFQSEGDWQLDWSSDDSVRRLDIGAEPAGEHVAARFEYFHQPSQLTLRVAARPSRLSVEPTYMVYVDARQLRLETLLKCRFRGAQAAGLRLQLGGWKLDRLTPDALFDLPVPEASGEVFVPLRSGAQIPAELELKLEAHQSLAAAGQRVAFDLPQIEANNIAPATLLVFAADNIELAPSTADLIGLSPETTSVRLPGRQQAPLVYRDLGGGEAARFVAGLRTLERITTAAARARVRIDAQQMQIEQRIDYRVAHEAQRVFSLLAPSVVVAAGNPQVLLGDEPLALSPAHDGSAAPGQTRLTFTAPADQIGAFQATVRYALPLRWDRRESLPLTIPLIVPALAEADQFAGQQVEFSLAEGLQIEPRGEGLEAGDEPQPLIGSLLAYSWSKPLTTSDWTLESSQDTEGGGIAVSQMWVQTWLSPRVRQERAAIRLRADRETIVVKIDRTVKQSSVQTAVDGREAPRYFRQAGTLVVTLPPAVRGRECVLELSYTLDPPLPRLGLMRDQWRAASIEDAQPPRRMYWQLVLPADQHLLMGPADLAAEMNWPASRWFSRPRAVFDQRQLEAWIKATPQEPLPRGANEYLYGVLSRWPAAEITIASRRMMVIVASSIVLALGLVLVHVPALRRAELALIAAVLVGAGSLLAPEFVVLMAQASALGLAVVIVAAVWSWATVRPIRPLAPVNSTLTRPRESRSTRPPARADRSSRVTTTAPGHAAVVEVRP